jgi:tripartite-type tricarboxylate transporter receptor subunit TctC
MIEDSYQAKAAEPANKAHLVRKLQMTHGPFGISRRVSATALGALLFANCTSSAPAQPYPSRPITFAVGVSAGGVSDAAARVIGAEMARKLNGTIVVENRVGASGVIAATSVAKSRPDGYSICFCSGGPMTLMPAQREDPSFKPSDLVPVSLLYNLDLFLIARSDLQVKTLNELVALSRSKPGKITYGTAGVGSITHLGMEYLKRSTGLDALHVPYKGGAPLMADLLGKQIDLGLVSAMEATSQLKEGNIAVVANLASKRSPLLEDVPTVAETVPGYVADSWIGLFVPVGTPAAVIEKLRSAAHGAMAAPAVREKLAMLGATPVDDPSPEAFEKMMVEERKKWTELVKQIGPIDQ